MLPCMQGEYHCSKLRPGTYALICKRQEAAGAEAHGLQFSAKAWEAKLPEISRLCREARDARAPLGPGLPSTAGGSIGVRPSDSCCQAHGRSGQCSCL